MFLFKIGNFDFDIASLISFVIGIFAGCALLAIVYSILVVSSLKSKKYIAKSNVIEVTDEEIKEIVSNARKAYSDKTLRGASSSVNHCFNVCTSMATDIARKFFPKSKRPLAELTIDEILELFIYISNRINGIIDRPALRLLKKLKLSTLLALGDAKKVIDDSSLMKLTKKYKLKKIINAVKGALNIFNPVYWARRLFINGAIDIAVNKLCLSIIGVVGEETYKIYSKRVFEEERYIDTNVGDIVSSIEEELENVSEEEVNEYIQTQGLEEKIEKKRKGK